mgnify:CR=1 FL=1
MSNNKWFWGLVTLLILLIYTGYLVIPANAGGRSEIPVMSADAVGDNALPKYADAISGVIRGSDDTPIDSADISIFDGFSLQNIKSDSKGVYNILQLPVSAGLSAVLFITKDGYVPSIINFKRREEVRTDYPVIMQRMVSKKAGYIGGVIYQPIRGGKIQFQSGINSFGRGKRVWLEKEGTITETKSNQDGHFIFEVPGGQYVLHAEGSRERPVVEITEGKTVIRNMRSGIVLVD